MGSTRHVGFMRMGPKGVSSQGLEEFAARLAVTRRDQRVLLQNLFGAELVQEGTKRTIRLHLLKADNNGRPQVRLLVSHLASSALDYCIPRKQIRAAVDHYERTGSTHRVAALHTQAKKLFADIANSGEGGELLLFLLTESVLGYPQVLAKMSLKTSSRMHVHGLDGVYLSCMGTPPALRLHFGESKLHRSPAGSVREAAASVASMLSDEGFVGAAERDFYLLNAQADLGDPNLEEALKGFLDPLDRRFLAPEVCAVLLAGHELETYPTIAGEDPLPKSVVSSESNLGQVLEQVAGKHGIERFHIDLFLVPFPNLRTFRNELLRELGPT